MPERELETAGVRHAIRRAGVGHEHLVRDLLPCERRVVRHYEVQLRRPPPAPEPSAVNGIEIWGSAWTVANGSVIAARHLARHPHHRQLGQKELQAASQPVAREVAARPLPHGGALLAPASPGTDAGAAPR